MLIGRKVKIVNTTPMLVDGYDVNRIRKSLYCTIDRLTERVADKFIVVSNSLKEQLIKKHFISEAKISKIYNGIEIAEYSTQVPDAETKELRKELNIDDSMKVIGAIGRMVWQKGFEYLIEAIPKILEPIPDVKFMIVGDGPLKIPLETMSRKLKVTDSVIFAGFRSDIREILAAIDILVIPSLLEGFPMVTLEAMAMAKPIIATRIDGVIEQITDGENGLLVPPKDHEALTESILKLIQDKELSGRLGRLARKKVEQEFSVEKMVAETEKVYLSLLSAN
jgi:glycosyltransferase involved in cell wall biosynthesis